MNHIIETKYYHIIQENTTKDLKMIKSNIYDTVYFKMNSLAPLMDADAAGRMQMQLAGCIYRTSFYTETLGPAEYPQSHITK